MDSNGTTHVVITDIRMPFWSMVVFMVKASIAAIPAVIILTILGAIVSTILSGIFGGMAQMGHM